MKSNRKRKLLAQNTQKLKNFTKNRILKKKNPRRMRIQKVIPRKNTQLKEKRPIGLNHDHVRENPTIEDHVTPSTIEGIPANITETIRMKKEIIIHQNTDQTTGIEMMTAIGTIAMRRKTEKKGMAEGEKRNHYFTNHDWSNHQ